MVMVHPLLDQSRNATPSRSSVGLNISHYNGFETGQEGFFICDTASEYRPRNPEDNLLYGVVSEYLETFLARQREKDRPVPRFVERELRAFLDCGVLANGFLRVH
jgi:hypothetical protein